MSPGADVWIQDPQEKWSLRFHEDPKSWSAFPFVFVDRGRAMRDGSPALLKSRSYLPKCDAIEIWTTLIEKGWKKVSPQWNFEIEP